MAKIHHKNIEPVLLENESENKAVELAKVEFPTLYHSPQVEAIIEDRNSFFDTGIRIPNSSMLNPVSVSIRKGLGGSLEMATYLNEGKSIFLADVSIEEAAEITAGNIENLNVSAVKLNELLEECKDMFVKGNYTAENASILFFEIQKLIFELFMFGLENGGNVPFSGSIVLTSALEIANYQDISQNIESITGRRFNAIPTKISEIDKILLGIQNVSVDYNYEEGQLKKCVEYGVELQSFSENTNQKLYQAAACRLGDYVKNVLKIDINEFTEALKQGGAMTLGKYLQLRELVNDHKGSRN